MLPTACIAAAACASASPVLSAPVNTGAPGLGSTGDLNNPLVGDQLSTGTGTWNNAPTSYALQWYSGASPVSGATSNVYTLQSSDVGNTVFCEITASNAAGSANADSNSSGTVLSAPVNTVAPNVTSSGDINLPVPGDTLSCDGGSWDYPPSLAYEWYSGGADTGQSGSSYTVQESDVGNSIYCQVTATNAAGSAGATSNGSGTVGVPPSNTAAPNIVSSAFLNSPTSGDVLTVDGDGSWTGSGLSYAFEWFSGGADTGQSGTSYTVQTSDDGNQIYCQVTATNTYGSAQADSNSSGTVQSGVPVNTGTPNISDDGAGGGSVGSPMPGDNLSVDTGGWLGGAFTPNTFSYQWFYTYGGGESVAGQTSNTYQVNEGDPGNAFECQVTATNSNGSTQAMSASSGTVVS